MFFRIYMGVLNARPWLRIKVVKLLDADYIALLRELGSKVRYVVHQNRTCIELLLPALPPVIVMQRDAR